MAANTSREKTDRAAWYVEVVLLVLTGLGIAALLVFWVQLETLLSSGESPALVRARLMRGIFSLVVPLVILLFVSTMRIRIGVLLEAQNAKPITRQSAKFIWLLVIAFVIAILSLDVFVIWTGFQDISFN